ncbi:MAG: hypothetical protein GF331_18285 [Chitinivibrionales bacterium]|nr:hypothetical protein [Chitinivibrionales bacterium]
MTGEPRMGTVYVLEPFRAPEQVRADLASIARTGFDVVTLWPAANSWLATRPDELVFDDTLRALDLCQQNGLEAVIQLIGQNQSQEYLPDCLVTTEMRAVDLDGCNTNCFWANPNHPAVDAAIKRYLGETVSALRGHPAVHAWDVFNEAHLRTDDPFTVARYREWLGERYGSIERLNERWGRRYASFDEIDITDRRAPYSIWSSLLPATDYELFRAADLAAICARWVAYVKQHDRAHPVIIDGTSGQILEPDVTARNCDEFAVARTPDIYGGTFYPKSWGRNLTDDIATLSLYYDLAAGAASAAGKPFVVSELQTHTQSALTPGSEVSPRELSAWTWIGLAAGAREFHYWRWRPFGRGYQATGRGLTTIDGSPNERTAAAARVCERVRRHRTLLRSSTPHAPVVALLTSYRCRAFHDAFTKWNGSTYAPALRFWHHLLWESALPTAIESLDGFTGSNAPVLVLPSGVSVSESEARSLRQFVTDGGLLIADARLGTVDEWGDVPQSGIPGPELAGLFGMREIDVGPASSFALDGVSLPAPFLTQRLQPLDGARVVAHLRDGSPAVVEHTVGAGRTLYFATCIGLSDHAHLAPLATFIRDQVRRHRPATPWAAKSGRVHVRFHTVDDDLLVYLVSLSDSDERVVLHNVGTVLETGESDGNAVREPDGTVSVRLEPWQTVLIHAAMPAASGGP